MLWNKWLNLGLVESNLFISLCHLLLSPPMPHSTLTLYLTCILLYAFTVLKCVSKHHSWQPIHCMIKFPFPCSLGPQANIQNTHPCGQNGYANWHRYRNATIWLHHDTTSNIQCRCKWRRLGCQQWLWHSLDRYFSYRWTKSSAPHYSTACRFPPRFSQWTQCIMRSPKSPLPTYMASWKAYKLL